MVVNVKHCLLAWSMLSTLRHSNNNKTGDCLMGIGMVMSLLAVVVILALFFFLRIFTKKTERIRSSPVALSQFPAPRTNFEAKQSVTPRPPCEHKDDPEFAAYLDELLRSKSKSEYSMPLAEFRKIIIPLLLKYPFSSIGYTDEEIEWLYDYSGNDWVKQRDAREELAWHFNEATRHTARGLRHNYESLLRARKDGFQVVRISAHARCSCLAFLDGKSAQVSEMLNAFEGQAVNVPVLPPLETPCAFDQERQDICPCALIPVGQFTSAGAIPENWRACLLDRTVEPMVNKLRNVDNDIEETSRKIRNFDREYRVENHAEALSHRLSISDLRALQRKHGVSGFRTKIDIAEQLLSEASARDDLDAIFEQIRSDRFIRLRERQEELAKNRESLIAMLHDIKQRLDGKY
jgi:hypothetical protein